MLGWSRNFPTGKELTAFIPCPKNGTMAWAASPISTQCDFRWKGEHFTDIMGWAGNRKKSLTRACLRKKAIRIWTGCLGLIIAKFFYTLASLPWYFDEKKKDNDNSKTANGGGGVAQWKIACLPCLRSWVQFPEPGKKKGEINSAIPGLRRWLIC